MTKLCSLGKTRRDVANMVRKQRKIGDLPPLYPNGWYEVMRSEELPVGAVKAVFMIGKHFAVFRRENGQVGTGCGMLFGLSAAIKLYVID